MMKRPSPAHKFEAGQVVLVAMKVVDPQPQNDYRGLYYIMCEHPYDGQDGKTPEPVPIHTIRISDSALTGDLFEGIPDDPVAAYYWLLASASYASKEVDYFDLRSEDPASKAEWDRLCAQSDAYQRRLIEHVLDYWTTLFGVMQR